ncbi:MAG: hypothetical protein ABI586_04155 [Candidatus Nanopelagicales bacterium]
MITRQDAPLAARREDVFAYASLPRWSWPTRLLVATIAGLVSLSLVAIYFWYYARVSALDDYRSGYAVGSLSRLNDDRDLRCEEAAAQLYGVPSRMPGYPGFLIGCRDGQAGSAQAPWWGLRAHIQNGVG